MNTEKKVTVLMPVYNGEKYLSEAINSILSQTYKDFELLIINDGSTDKSEEIIKGYNDQRIKYIANDYNIGIIRTLNKGLSLIKSEYIARMDADDVSLPERLEKQIQFMDTHPDIAVSGTSILMFNETGNLRKKRVNKDPKQLKTELLFKCALMHPTVMIRKRVIDEGNFTYNEAHQSVEDFGLWQNLSFYYKLSNIQEVLVKYRVNETGITEVAKKDTQKSDNMHIRVYEQAIEYFGIDVSQEDLTSFRYFLTGRAFTDRNRILAVSKLLDLLKNTIEKHDYDLEIFNNLICSYFKANCLNARFNYYETRSIYKEFFNSIFKFSFKEKTKYVIRRIFLLRQLQ